MDVWRRSRTFYCSSSWEQTLLFFFPRKQELVAFIPAPTLSSLHSSPTKVSEHGLRSRWFHEKARIIPTSTHQCPHLLTTHKVKDLLFGFQARATIPSKADSIAPMAFFHGCAEPIHTSALLPRRCRHYHIAIHMCDNSAADLRCRGWSSLCRALIVELLGNGADGGVEVLVLFAGRELAAGAVDITGEKLLTTTPWSIGRISSDLYGQENAV